MQSERNDNTETRIREVIAQWRGEASVQAIVPLVPDASLRRYFRVFLANLNSPKTVLAMVFDSVAPAELGGKLTINSDDACVLMTQFLLQNGISVPQQYLQHKEKQIILIEDLGDNLLAHELAGVKASSAGKQRVLDLYRQAIDELVKFQAIPVDAQFFPYQRGFTSEVYMREMREFQDYVLVPKKQDLALSEELFAAINESLKQIPTCLCHRDYHSWNLMVDANSKVFMIDFQDALIGPRVYDIISLLNDRDTDSMLGVDLYSALKEYYRLKIGLDVQGFDFEFYTTLLQRDLKVAGRFNKLASERGLTKYLDWVPGTLRRIGTSLQMLAKITEQKVYREIYNQLFIN